MNTISSEINNLVANKMEAGIKEKVSSNLCFEALTFVKNQMVYTKEDVILFCAALNLLNTYVKQPDSKIGYDFKGCINRLFIALMQHNIPGVKISMEISSNKKGGEVAYVIIQIDDVQFSFHQIKLTKNAYLLKQNTDLVHDLEFDGLRKQMCAVSIYEIVKSTLS